MTDREIVGVGEGATKEEIEQAFKKRAMLVHPDRGGSDEAFQNLVAAKDRLISTAPSSGEKKTCPQCRGEGKVTVSRGFAVTKLECGECGGEGEVS